MLYVLAHAAADGPDPAEAFYDEPAFPDLMDFVGECRTDRHLQRLCATAPPWRPRDSPSSEELRQRRMAHVALTCLRRSRVGARLVGILDELDDLEATWKSAALLDRAQRIERVVDSAPRRDSTRGRVEWSEHRSLAHEPWLKPFERAVQLACEEALSAQHWAEARKAIAQEFSDDGANQTRWSLVWAWSQIDKGFANAGNALKARVVMRLEHAHQRLMGRSGLVAAKLDDATPGFAAIRKTISRASTRKPAPWVGRKVNRSRHLVVQYPETQSYGLTLPEYDLAVPAETP